MDSSSTAAYFASLPRMQYDSVPVENADIDSKPDTPLINIERESARKYLSPRLLLPTVAVVLGTAGLAITLIVWILTHKTQGSFAEAYRKGAFLLDEGYDVEAGLEAGRLIGLTISSAAVRCPSDSIDGGILMILISQQQLVYSHPFSWAYTRIVQPLFGPQRKEPIYPHLCSM